jgi:hypothetical protein
VESDSSPAVIFQNKEKNNQNKTVHPSKMKCGCHIRSNLIWKLLVMPKSKKQAYFKEVSIIMGWATGVGFTSKRVEL